jgi:protein phosphatase 1 regulatory subunit 7
LGANRISKIEGLETLIQLKELYLSENRIKTIENLDANINLTVLDIAKNQIEQLDNLQSLKNLNELWFNNNQIKNFDELNKLVSIETLRCIYVHDNPAFDREENYRSKVLLQLQQLTQLNATETRRAAPLTLD